MRYNAELVLITHKIISNQKHVSDLQVQALKYIQIQKPIAFCWACFRLARFLTYLAHNQNKIGGKI
jgi:hypothetical protein